MCPFQPLVCGWVGDSAAGAPTLYPTTPAKVCAWHVSPAPHARCARLSYGVYRRAGTRQGYCVPTCVRSSPGVWVGADTAADTPTHVPTMACAWNVSLAPHARCPPLPHVYRLQGEGGKGVLPPNMCPLQPWVCVGGESAPQPPTTPPTLPPQYVPTMCPRPHPHAVRHSHLYVDCGARPKQGCCPPTCARSSPGCVWGLCCGRPYPPPRHSRQECQNVCVACVPGPTRTLSATLLCM